MWITPYAARYSTATRAGLLMGIVDTDTLKEIVRLPGGVFPDGIAYDPKEKRIFVSDELGAAVSIIDAASNHFVARIPAGGEVGNVRYDPVTFSFYAPIQSKNELEAFNPQKGTPIAGYPNRSRRNLSHARGLAHIARKDAQNLGEHDRNSRVAAPCLRVASRFTRQPDVPRH